MSAYVTPPVFDDYVDQLISAADLEILRSNVALAEGSSIRWSEAFSSSGGLETGFAPRYYNTSSGDVCIAWDGYLMVKAGMTTLGVEGRTESMGICVFSLWIDGVNKQSWTPGTSSFTRTQSLSGYAVGQVIRIQIKVQNTSGNLSETGLIFIKDIYGYPLTVPTTYPGVPTFTGQFDAANLNQLSNASAWVINRSALVPRPPLLSTKYSLGSIGANDLRPIHHCTIGHYYSQQHAKFDLRVDDNFLPSAHLLIVKEGVTVWDSGVLPQGSSTFSIWVSMADITIGNRCEFSVWAQHTTAAPRTVYHFNEVSITHMTGVPNDSAVFTTPTTTPAADTTMTATSLNAYLNNLCSIVTASKARIDAQPNFYNRVRAQRRYVGRANGKDDELAQKRNPPRFWRFGDALVVNGKKVSLAYGGATVPINDRGPAFFDYKWNNEDQIIQDDHVATQVLWLDTVNGVEKGDAYFLSGEVRWAEESLL